MDMQQQQQQQTLPADAPSARLCHLIKWPDFDGYGFNLHAEKEKSGQFIGKVDDDSPAMLAGLREGDRIVEVNFVNISNENHRQVVERIKSIPNETRLLVVDVDADRWYKGRRIVIKSSHHNVIYYKTPVPRPLELGLLPVPSSPDMALRNRMNLPLTSSGSLNGSNGQYDNHTDIATNGVNSSNNDRTTIQHETTTAITNRETENVQKNATSVLEHQQSSGIRQQSHNNQHHDDDENAATNNRTSDNNDVVGSNNDDNNKRQTQREPEQRRHDDTNQSSIVHREERNVLDELLFDHEDDELEGETRTRETPTKVKAKIESMELDGELLLSDSECSCEDHSSANSDVDMEGEREQKESSPTQAQPSTAAQQPPATTTVKKPIEMLANDERDEFAKSPSLKIEIRRKSRHTIIRHSNGDSHDHHHHHHHNHHDHHHHHHHRTREHDDGRRTERTKRSERLPIAVRSNSNNNGRRRSRDRTPERSSRNGTSVTRTHNNDELLKYFFKDAIYFMVKSNNAENVDISMRDGVWSTPAQNEARWNSAFKQFRNVILVFSVKESGRFAGFARLSSQSDYDCEPVSWILPPGVAPFGGVFYIDWICKNELPFTQTSHLYNSFNDGKPVKIARDGQEIEPQVGEELCRLFPIDNSVDLIPHLKRMKKQTQNRKKTKHIRGPFMSAGGGGGDRPSNVAINGRSESYNHSISRGQMPYTNDGSFERRTRSVTGTFDRSRLQLHTGNGVLRSRATTQSYHPYSRAQSNGNGGGHYMEQSSGGRTARHYSRQNSAPYNSSYGHSNGGSHYSSQRYDHDRPVRRPIRNERDYH